MEFVKLAKPGISSMTLSASHTLLVVLNIMVKLALNVKKVINFTIKNALTLIHCQ